MGTAHKRQCRDWMELNIQWGFVTSFVSGIMVARLKYGQCQTRRRIFMTSMAIAPFQMTVLGLITYFVCPWCQEPNRGVLQSLSPEQRFKNHLDEKYNLYEHVDEKLYTKFTQPYPRKQFLQDYNKELDRIYAHQRRTMEGQLQENKKFIEGDQKENKLNKLMKYIGNDQILPKSIVERK
eukprot:403368542